MAQGYSGPEIAEQLTLTINSVKGHVQHLYAKLGVHSRRQARARARELGLLKPAPHLPQTFALAAAQPGPARRHNLPQQVTQFFGREAETIQVKERLAEHRLVTLTGSGGVGKTRLSLRVAEELLSDFQDGIWFVELASLNDAALVPQAVAITLGIHEDPGCPLLETLAFVLRDRRVLLVLDNCEHLLDACARLVDALVRACPRLRLLACSRETLGIAGEAIFPVPSLPFPNLGQKLSLERTGEYASVRLFVARASATTAHFALTPENVAAVAQVCWRLDGIPLALELAAARLRMLPVEELAARLDDAFQVLTGGSRTALPRHQTLQALIDWSYELLPDAEQKLLCRLAVFAGGWTLAAAEAVCAGEGLAAEAITSLLGRLIDKSLVLVDQRAGSAHYRLIETVRQYAQAKLVASGEANEMRGRHAAFYLAFAEAGAPYLTGRLQPAWHDQMEREHDNLRAALKWCQSAPSKAEFGLRLTAALWDFWYRHGYSSEQCGWTEGALGHPEAANYPRWQAIAYVNLGGLVAVQGNYDSGEAHIAHSLRLFRELGDRPSSAGALNRLGWVARERGDSTTARARLEESLALYRELGDQSGICGSTTTLAEAMSMQGDLVAARALLDESLKLARHLEDTFAIGWALNHLGHIAQLEREYVEALRLHEASLQPFGELGGLPEGFIWAHQSLGETYLAQGDASLAASHFVEALVIARDLGQPPAMAWCLAGLAGAAAVNEEPERAAWLWGAAEALRQSIGVREAPASHDTHERLKAQARERIGEAAFATQWAAGGTAPLTEAIERALQAEVGA